MLFGVHERVYRLQGQRISDTFDVFTQCEPAHKRRRLTARTHSSSVDTADEQLNAVDAHLLYSIMSVDINANSSAAVLSDSDVEYRNAMVSVCGGSTDSHLFMYRDK